MWWRRPWNPAGAAWGDPLVESVTGDELGIGNATVARIWRKYQLQPWRRQTFKFSADPELEAKVRDVVGLYLNPGERMVLCINGKSQVLAADRANPAAAPRAARAGTHDYIRQGTTTLLCTALEVANGKVTDTCLPRHRH